MLATQTGGSTNNVSKLVQNTSNYNNNTNSFEPSIKLTRISNSAENLTTFAADNVDTKRPPNQSLIEKKKLKWDQDKKEASVPWIATNNALASEQPPIESSQNIQIPNPRSRKYKDSMEEYQHISKTLEAIIAAENKIKQEEVLVQPEPLFRKPYETEHQSKKYLNLLILCFHLTRKNIYLKIVVFKFRLLE